MQVIERGDMPPKGEGSLTADETKQIRDWIQSGAEFHGQRTQPSVTSERIVPLMLLRCVPCHGGRRKEGGLDLRTRESILRGGQSGPVVIPGDPDNSLIVRRIQNEQMPPRRQLVSVSVKPMESTELELLRSWISAGLPAAPPADVNVSSGETSDGASHPENAASEHPEAERRFWSFQPPQAVSPPDELLTAEDRGRVRNPIDVFVLTALRKQGLAPAPEADRRTLIRRVTLDLTGLQPAPEEVTAFLNDNSPDAWERLVDRLLASPRYGERWARHWLDVAGYADSEGAQNEDRIRPTMWRYRDYVIRAFNSDKPYDRFLQEQIAGDELADYRNAAEITEELCDNLVATGFLRTAPDRTFANITNFVPDRLEVIADEIQILGSAVMGLTLHCARCHSHKFDPISQRDYYRLAASLKDALDEHDWIGPEARVLSVVTTTERKAWEEHEQRLTSEQESLRQQLTTAEDETAKKSIEQQIDHLQKQRRPEPQIRALWSRGDPSPTFVLRRGNYLTPGPEVLPGVPAVLTSGSGLLNCTPPWPGATTTGRRLALARWLTQAGHPLTSRVMVNRIWKHHFGRGLVSSMANFGLTGTPPSHPDLLDWLAVRFVESGWSIKAMHRLMLGSSVYRQSSHAGAETLKADPDNRFLARMPLRRLEAEAVRDVLLQISGRLDLTPFGPADDVDVRADGLVTPRSTEAGGRRSIYCLHRRTKLPTILENFDSPQMGPNCTERGESVVATQALHLLNNGAIQELAGHFARRVEQDAGDNPGDQISRVFTVAYGREPDAEERQFAIEFLRNAALQWEQHASASAGSDKTDQLSASIAPSTLIERAHKMALQNLCHAIMNSAELLYTD